MTTRWKDAWPGFALAALVLATGNPLWLAVAVAAPCAVLGVLVARG